MFINLFETVLECTLLILFFIFLKLVLRLAYIMLATVRNDLTQIGSIIILITLEMFSTRSVSSKSNSEWFILIYLCYILRISNQAQSVPWQTALRQFAIS